MTSESPWSQNPTASEEPASSPASGVAGPIVVLALLITTTVGAGVAWWLQDSRVAAKEQERAAAAAELAKLSTRVQTAEATASSATQELKKAQALAEASAKQATEASGQVDALRKESAGVRTERDEARSALSAAKAEMERARVNDLDPGSLPQVDLAKVFARTANYRTMVDFQLAGSNAVPGLDKAEVEKMLGASMQSSGMSVVPQSPFRVAVFVSIGREKVRSVGVMMLVLRNMKVPGEAGSREVAVWGQQRTSSATDTEASGQVRGLLEELCREFAKAAGVQPVTAPPSAPPAAPAASPAPASAPAAAPAPAPAAAPVNATKP
jgi:hypothetical protein